MATTIRASCNECGEVNLCTQDVTLLRVMDSGWTSYRFNCPTCGRMVLRQAEKPVVDLLTHNGVELHVTSIPRELNERGGIGVNLTLDDLIDFALELVRHTHLARYADSGNSAQAA